MVTLERSKDPRNTVVFQPVIKYYIDLDETAKIQSPETVLSLDKCKHPLLILANA